MSPVHHLGMWKLATWAVGSAVVMVGAFIAEARQGMSPSVEVALITSICSLLTAVTTGAVSIYMQRRTGQKVDGILTQAHAEEKAATTRADSAEGFTRGSDSERAKEKSDDKA